MTRVIAKVGDLGRYRLVAELARGGMGVVYLALVRGPGGFNKLFVVKELKAHLAEDPNLVRMFVEEARLAAKLSHPNVVQTIEVGSEGERHYLAMEHLDGQSLHRALSRARKLGRPFPFHFFLHLLARALEGLDYAHSLVDFDGAPLGLVHRDVSPHNVFVTYDGQVKLLDFGIAKANDSSFDTKTGILKGKVSYMAPEQAAGQPIDRRADVFSAGVMLFEAATGKRMWGRAENDLQILHALIRGAVPRPREAQPDVDPEVERIVLKATAARREDRYATAAEMQADVEALLERAGAPPFGGRDVGKLVAEIFAVERAHIQQVIDAQLRVLRRVGSGEYGDVDLPQLGATSPRSITPSGVQIELTAGSVAPSRGTIPSASLPPPRRRAPWAFVLGAAIAIALAGAVVLRRAPPAPGTTSAPPASAASAPATRAASAAVKVLGGPSDVSPDAPKGQAPPAAPPPPRRAPPRKSAPAPAAAVVTVAAAPTAGEAGAPPPLPSPSVRNRQPIDTRDPYAQ